MTAVYTANDPTLPDDPIHETGDYAVFAIRRFTARGYPKAPLFVVAEGGLAIEEHLSEDQARARVDALAQRRKEIERE